MSSKSQKGGILIELAICAPLLLMIFTAIVGTGMAYRTHATLFEAVRVAGRALADSVAQSPYDTDGNQVEVGRTLCTEAVSITEKALEGNGFNKNDYTITITPIQLVSDTQANSFSLCGSMEFNGAEIKVVPVSGFLKFFGGIITTSFPSVIVSLQSRYPIHATPCNAA